MEANPAYQMQQQPQALPREAREGFDSSTSYFSNPVNDGKRDDLVYKVEQQIDETLQPGFRDVSYGMAQSLTDTIYSAAGQQQFPSRREALDYFDRNFLNREITRVKGNITQYVRDAFDLDDPLEINKKRRNIYRKIGKHGLGEAVDAARPWKQTSQDELEDRLYKGPSLGAEQVESTLTSTLAGYRDKLHPQLYDTLSDRIKESSAVIAQNVSNYMPTPANRLKEIFATTEGMTKYDSARTTFERHIVYDALAAAEFDKNKAAKYLGDSLRTLNRRIAELGLEEELTKQEEAGPEEGKVISMEDAIKKKMGELAEADELPADVAEGAVDEIERFQQLVREYNSKREAERERRQKAQQSPRSAI